MHRIQVQLTDEQERALREMARVRGASISALVREGVEQIITPQASARQEARKRALELIGAYDFGTASDLAVKHDKYIADATYENLRGEGRPR